MSARRALTVLLAAGCAGWGAAAAADPLAHEWCEYRTPRFTVVTDLPAGRVRELAEQMEIFRQTAGALINRRVGGEEADAAPDQRPGAALAAPPLKVVVFRRRGDFRTAMKSEQFSGFMAPSLRENLLVFGPQQGNRLLHETALHEYAHFLLRNQIDVNVPVWVDEGMASLLSTMAVTARHVVIGRAGDLKARSESLRRSRLKLDELVVTRYVTDWDNHVLSDFYGWTWLLMHHLELGHLAGFPDRRPQLEAYLRSPGLDFEQAFGVSYRALRRDLVRYVSKSSLPQMRLPRPEVELEALERRCLSSAERNYELALVMLDRNPQQALALMSALVEADPHDTRVRLGMSYVHEELGQLEEALEHAEAALAAAPADAGANTQVGALLVRDCILIRGPGCNERWAQAVQLFRRAMRADPRRFDAVLGLGLSYLHSGRPGEAVNYFRVAYRKAPWAPHLNFYLGESYRLVGDARARRHLTNARNWARNELWQRLADAALERMDS